MHTYVQECKKIWQNIAYIYIYIYRRVGGINLQPGNRFRFRFVFVSCVRAGEAKLHVRTGGASQRWCLWRQDVLLLLLLLLLRRVCGHGTFGNPCEGFKDKCLKPLHLAKGCKDNSLKPFGRCKGFNAFP